MLKSKKMLVALIAGFAIIIAAVIIIQKGEQTMTPISNKTTKNDYVIFEKREASNQLDSSDLDPLYLNTYLYNSGKLVKEGTGVRLKRQIDEERMEKVKALIKQIIKREECSGGQPLPSGTLNYLLRYDRKEKSLIGLTPCDEELGKIEELVDIKIYRNEKFNFEFSVPKNATVSELNDGVYVNKIILDSKDIATIRAYKAVSVDDWLSNNINFAIDGKGNKIPSYERKIINGNSAAILYDRPPQARCIKQAIIHHDQVAVVINWLATPNNQNQYIYDASYCPVVQELVGSFRFEN